MKKILLIFGVILIIVAFVYFIYNNKKISVTKITIPAPKAMTILHLSDLHNDSFGKNNEKLLKIIKELKYDYIVITGDIIDKRKPNIDQAISLTKKLTMICPVVFVAGNHESELKDYMSLKKGLIEAGVIVLDNEKIIINDCYQIIGITDPEFYNRQKQKEVVDKLLDEVMEEDEYYHILLSHKPHFINEYSRHNLQLVLSGHCHGGQVRVPFIGGLYAPGQGVLPKYTEGLHIIKNTKLIISRGLGHSLFPLRINNNPEIVCIIFEENNI